MKVGDSFVISPDEPHAYISGELMEAMVNSDNVVRGGLTPKLKDTNTL
jgi:mannose-6-phosphate isomerase